MRSSMVTRSKGQKREGWGVRRYLLLLFEGLAVWESARDVDRGRVVLVLVMPRYESLGNEEQHSDCSTTTPHMN